MKENGFWAQISEWAEVFKYGRMVLGMRVFGKTTQLGVQDALFMQTVIFTLGIGLRTKLMVKELTYMLMVHVMKEIGLMTNNTELVVKSGQMAQSLKVNMLMAKSRVKVFLIGQTVRAI